MDIGKAYDKFDRDGLWNAHRLYGLSVRLLKGVKSFYVNRGACLSMGNSMNEWFHV